MARSSFTRDTKALICSLYFFSLVERLIDRHENDHHSLKIGEGFLFSLFRPSIFVFEVNGVFVTATSLYGLKVVVRVHYAVFYGLSLCLVIGQLFIPPVLGF